ncbi:MAG: precorrin-8X methylmutase [Hyphomicrobiales bacterium]|nr:precorrin-8X methylmutase [Hyphomicrobiales bacterium]
MSETHSLAYLRDPEEIYRRSFAAVRAATDLSALPESIVDVAVRLVHACGDPAIVSDLAWGGDPAFEVRAALQRAAPVIADCTIVVSGITRRRLPAGVDVLCTLNDRRVAGLARQQATTRSAAAVDLWRPDLEGSVVAIGNAPTALFRLVEELLKGAPRPAAILAFPVGFIGAAESKQALARAELGVPYLTLRGRRGGSALAAAAVNALASGSP